MVSFTVFQDKFPITDRICSSSKLLYTVVVFLRVCVSKVLKKRYSRSSRRAGGNRERREKLLKLRDFDDLGGSFAIRRRP